ncbi:OprO/OprP family phosphate-selective porin, partial [bacterium]|nr:OprO/OprP family phosphate-selective porin [bacterium]
VFENLGAQGPQNISIHGFAGWAYGRTDGNSYLVGTEDGEYGNINYAFVVAAAPHERLRINTSVEFRQGQIGDVKSLEAQEEFQIELDFAFAEWRFSDHARFRMGRVKHPFGIFGEVLDVGTVRPLLALSTAVYGPGMIAEAYNGFGITGSYQGADWGLAYDLYGGGIEFEGGQPVIPGPDEGEQEEDEVAVSELIGARLTITTPYSGLMFGLSAYTGSKQTESEESGAEAAESDRRSSVGFHTEFAREAWSIRGEFSRVTENNALSINAFYVEAAYSFNDHWQMAARYDNVDLELDREAVESSFLDHREWVVGLNYWFTSNFVIRLAYHNVDGNRFAIPSSLDEPAAVDQQTNMISFGAQFSF